MEANGDKTDDGSRDDQSKEDQLEDTLRRFNFLAALRERKQVRRGCVEALRLYRQIEAEIPQSSRLERYIQILERRSSADPRSASKIMRLFWEGIAHSPAERPFNFREVVQIIVVTEYLSAPATGGDGRPRDVDFVFDVISEVIPAHL